MKHLKMYERLIPISDDRVINNPLYDFANKLKNEIEKLKKIDNINNTAVKIYFNSTGEILISYKYTSHFQIILNIRLQTMNLNSLTKIEINKNNTSTSKSISQKFIEFMLDEFDGFLNVITFKFENNNKVINKIKKFIKKLDIEMTQNKYNL